MPVFQQGDMWTAYDAVDLFLISTNSYVKSDGTLTMGRGIAREARDRWPGIDRKLGTAVRLVCGHLGVYGLLLSPQWPAAKLGLFQVKRDVRTAADLALIARSTAALHDWCRFHPDATVALNFPGIGNGRRARADVLPLLASLPDAVAIWERPAPE